MAAQIDVDPRQRRRDKISSQLSECVAPHVPRASVVRKPTMLNLNATFGGITRSDIATPRDIAPPTDS